MTYTIDYSDGTTFDIPANTVNTDTSLNLPGKGYRDYGEIINENFLHLLENFSNDTMPSNSIEGQLWYDSDNDTLKIYDGSNYNELITNKDGKFTLESSNGFPQIKFTNSDLSNDPFYNDGNTNTYARSGELRFEYGNNILNGFLRQEVIDDTQGSERSRALYNVKTRYIDDGSGSDANTGWSGIYFGYNDDSHTAGFSSIGIACAPSGNDADLLLTGQSANFNVAIRPPLLDDDPSSTHSSEIHQSPQEGQIIYNTTSNKLKFYNGSSWSEIGSGGSGSSTFIDLTDTPGSFTADRFLKVNSGGDAIEFATLSSSNIPNLPASKITSGTFSTARLASGGSVDQVLTRTSTGMAWEDSQGGGSGAFTDGTNGVYYNGSKNVGIGLTNPTHKLEVDGTISASGEITAYSDERLKENIEKIDSPLDKVLNMRGILYNKIGETEQKMGLIAQEVQEVIPQVVNEGEYLSISYGNLVGLLIEAIKELKDEVNNLKNQEIQ